MAKSQDVPQQMRPQKDRTTKDGRFGEVNSLTTMGAYAPNFLMSSVIG